MNGRLAGPVSTASRSATLSTSIVTLTWSTGSSGTVSMGPVSSALAATGTAWIVPVVVHTPSPWVSGRAEGSIPWSGLASPARYGFAPSSTDEVSMGPAACDLCPYPLGVYGNMLGAGDIETAPRRQGPLQAPGIRRGAGVRRP